MLCVLPLLLRLHRMRRAARVSPAADRQLATPPPAAAAGFSLLGKLAYSYDLNAWTLLEASMGGSGGRVLAAGHSPCMHLSSCTLSRDSLPPFLPHCSTSRLACLPSCQGITSPRAHPNNIFWNVTRFHPFYCLLEVGGRPGPGAGVWAGRYAALHGGAAPPPSRSWRACMLASGHARVHSS